VKGALLRLALAISIPFALALAVCLLGLGVAPPDARADDPAPAPQLDGAWSMTAISESFTVQQWSAACGPAPGNGTTVPGGAVTVSSQGGELVISGGKRTLRTNQCLDPLPTLSPGSHSHDARSWRTQCSTPANDPRHAVVNTAYFVAPGDSTISIGETGRYEFTINDSRCIADVKRGGSLSRVVAAVASSAPPPPVAPPTAKPPAATGATPPAVDCSSPDDPARLEVRPSRKLLKLGDSFAFRAVVLDASGCPTGTPIKWSVADLAFADGQAHPAQPSIDASGKLTVPDTDFADATFTVVATAAGKSARASVQATSGAQYEALLAQSGLDSNGELDTPAVAILATSSIGGGDARVQDGAKKRRYVFIGVVASLALALGIVAMVGARRSRRAKEIEHAAEERHAEKMRDYEQQKRAREEQHAAQMRAHVESVARAQQQAAAAAAKGVDTGPMYCPSCRREFPSGSTFCPFDANRLVAIAGHADIVSGPAGGICPTCRRGYNPGVKACPHDGDELVPYAMAAAAPGVGSAAVPEVKGKICPTCGGRFEGTAAFCGKDGTQLVLLN
jgi:hypothetical protein